MARKPKLDTILADAVDVARNALTEIAVDTEIGEYLGATSEGERLVTHRFVSQKRVTEAGRGSRHSHGCHGRKPKISPFVKQALLPAKTLFSLQHGCLGQIDWQRKKSKQPRLTARRMNPVREASMGNRARLLKRIRQLPTNQSRAVSRNQLTVLRSKSRLRLLKQMLWRASRHLRDVRSVDVVQHSALLLVAAQRSAVVHVKTTWTEQNRGITQRSADESLKDSSADRCANCVVRAVRRRSRCSAARRQHRLGRSPQM